MAMAGDWLTQLPGLKVLAIFPYNGYMAVETFNPSQRLLTIEGSSALYRTDIHSYVEKLACVPPAEAEHLVASAGEDERNYAMRGRSSFLDALCRQIDEFLADDDGGYHIMRVHFTASERSDALLEVWFNVASPHRGTGGVWFRQMVVGLDSQSVYAALGGAGNQESGTGDQVQNSSLTRL